jgi:hypothetical protein
MIYLPAYIAALFLLLATTITIRAPLRPSIAQRSIGSAAAMLVCHNALIRYSDQNPSVAGTVPAALVDELLPPGLIDPGGFSYLIAGGQAVTFLTSPPSTSATVIKLVQQLGGSGSVLAGQVVGPNLVPLPPNVPIAAPPGVPGGTVAIVTTIGG